MHPTYRVFCMGAARACARPVSRWRRLVHVHEHFWNRVGVRHDSSMFVAQNVTRHWRYLAYDTATSVTFDMPRSENIWR